MKVRTFTDIAQCSLALALAVQLQDNTPEISRRITEIHLTDGLSELMPLLERNAMLNNLTFIRNGEHAATSDSAIRVHASVLSWGEPISASIPGDPDIILAADCAYFEPSFPLLLGTLQQLMGTDTILFFSYKKRRKGDKSMIQMLGKKFDVQEVKGIWERDGVWLFEIRKRSYPTNDGAKHVVIEELGLRDVKTCQ